METYKGQAYIKLYEDSACTKEFKISPNGDYVINILVPTGQSNVDYKKNLYYRNLGSHTAYNINVTKVSDSSNKATVSLDRDILATRHRGVVNLAIPFTKGEIKNYTLVVKLEYDNIP